MKTLIILLSLGGVALNLYGEDDDEWTGHDLFDQICLNCHDLYTFYGDERSEKGWELTVFNMQDRGNFSDEEAYKIIEYLSGGTFDRDYFPEDLEDEKVDETIAVASAPPPVSPTKAQRIAKARKRLQKQIEESNTLKRYWNPSKSVLKGARLLGYTAIISLALLAVTGYREKKMGSSFKPAHRVLSAILFLSIAVHAVIYIFKYGTPAVIWLWYGIAALIILTASFVLGYARKRLRINFRAVHYGLGALGAGLSILHWIWAWL